MLNDPFPFQKIASKGRLRMNVDKAGLCAMLAFVAGCSNSASVPLTPTPVVPTPAAKQAIATMKIFIPAGSARNAKTNKHRAYVSPATLGIIIAIDTVSSGTTTLSSVTGYNVGDSENSTTCGEGNDYGTVCTLTLDAPPTNDTSQDTFSIFTYDAAQTTGVLAANYVPSGNLLTQDVADPVPSVTNTGIIAGTTNSLTFSLIPIVKTAELGTNSGEQYAPIVLSAPGGGGYTNGLSIDGLDARHYPIEDGTQYINPITITSSSSQVVSMEASVTTASADFIKFLYTPGEGDEGTPTGIAPFSATISTTESFTGGGYDGTTTFPASVQTTEIAPLFSYVPPSPATNDGFVTTVYALQAALPTGEYDYDYAISVSPRKGTNDCSSYEISPPQAGTSSSVQAMFTVMTSTPPATGTTCTLYLTDQLSTVTFTLDANGNRIS